MHDILKRIKIEKFANDSDQQSYFTDTRLKHLLRHKIAYYLLIHS